MRNEAQKLLEENFKESLGSRHPALTILRRLSAQVNMLSRFSLPYISIFYQLPDTSEGINLQIRLLQTVSTNYWLQPAWLVVDGVVAPHACILHRFWFHWSFPRLLDLFIISKVDHLTKKPQNGERCLKEIQSILVENDISPFEVFFLITY